MNIIKLILATTVASALLVGVMPTTVLADTAASQNQEVEMECTTTSEAYGQSKATCKNTSKQRQLITTREGVKIHKVLDTGLDTNSLSVVLGTLTTGTLAFVAKRKLNA